MRLQSESGFTLIELVMVMIIIAVLAAVSLPNFIDFRTDAKNAAVKGALSGLRSSIAVARVAIALKEAQGVPKYPTFAEMSANAFNASHPILSGKNIVDPSAGVPVNPWTDDFAPPATRAKIFDCSALAMGGLLAFPNTNRGWCYDSNSGKFWANSALNGGTAGNTENDF